MTKDELAAPNNGADCTINLCISGNRLVSVLNALDAAMHEARKYRFSGDEVVTISSWYDELRETTEAIRDELGRQRAESQGEGQRWRDYQRSVGQ
jgi:hypothetical protein